MDLTIGEELQAARKKNKISLEDASSATHIKKAYLQSLEDDQFDYLPSRAQVRGFIRLYGSYLGLDVQTLLARLDPVPEPIPVEPVVQPAKQSPVKKIIDRISKKETQPTEPAATVEPKQEVVQDQALPIFAEIGQSIKTQREKLNLTLEEISTHTHIRMPYLISLEAGEFDRLPSPMQVRGLLNNYAEFISMDANRLLDRYADALQARRVGLDAQEKVKPEPAKEISKSPFSSLRHFLTPDLIIGVFLIVMLFGFVIWGASQLLGSKKLSLTPTAPSISEVLLVTPSVVPTFGTTSIISPTVESTLAAGQVDTLAPETTISVSPTVLVASNSSLHLNITANQPAFLRILEDGRESFNGRVIAGNAYQYNANQTIELLTGNAAALDIVFNQNDLGILGSFGQPLHLIFSSQGIQTPTPLFTNTPTATQLPTLTPQPTPTVPTATITPLIPTP